MSLGLVVLEKLFTRTPQSDNISQLTDKSADIKSEIMTLAPRFSGTIVILLKQYLNNSLLASLYLNKIIHVSLNTLDSGQSLKTVMFIIVYYKSFD